MSQQVPLSENSRANGPQKHDGLYDVLPDLAYQRLAIVNVILFGPPDAGDGGWVLIDAGVLGTANTIASAAEARYGDNARPSAIIMTHGHFDHVGALEELAERWDVPAYAHELELPYLNGTASYPPADPTVGGGMMAWASRLYPRGPVDVVPRLRVLPDDGRIPPMPGWRWIHTPGHTPGHVSLWRESDRTLIAGDAFITTRQESAYAVATQKPEMHGPPMYYTQDFEKAHRSVQRLAALEPEVVITGHGRPMRGPEMRRALHGLAERFDQVAVPESGRYVMSPANVESGNAYRAP